MTIYFIVLLKIKHTFSYMRVHQDSNFITKKRNSVKMDYDSKCTCAYIVFRQNEAVKEKKTRFVLRGTLSKQCRICFVKLVCIQKRGCHWLIKPFMFENVHGCSSRGSKISHNLWMTQSVIIQSLAKKNNKNKMNIVSIVMRFLRYDIDVYAVHLQKMR